MIEIADGVVEELARVPRVQEPVTLGLPIADQLSAKSSRTWVLLDESGQLIPADFRPLAYWPSDNIRWLSATFLIDCPARTTRRMSLVQTTDDSFAAESAQSESAQSESAQSESAQSESAQSKSAQSESAQSESAQSKSAQSESAQSEAAQRLDVEGKVEPAQHIDIEVHANSINFSSGAHKLGVAISGELAVEGRGVQTWSLNSQTVVIEADGTPAESTSVMRRWTIPWRVASGLGGHIQLELYPAASVMRVEWTLHNSRRAEHAGGYWDLGDPQSFLLNRATLAFDLGSIFNAGKLSLAWAAQPEDAWHALDEFDNWNITQTSSGGANDRSRVHLDRHNHIAVDDRGYQVSWLAGSDRGERARPIVRVYNDAQHLTAIPVDFWQTFPNALRVAGNSLLWDLLPEQTYLHELQPGECLSKTVWLDWSPATRDSSPLDYAWVTKPLSARPTVAGLQRSGAVEWFTAATAFESGDYLSGLLEGERSFFAKREVIDEYGWRNYGETWADHEEKYSDDPKPVISHYNNQYDLLQGMIRAYLAHGDCRWRELAVPLMRHILDIDIYNTDQDRAAYNHALFWHTSHYRDAFTATHRSFSRQMTGEKHAVHGGGPSNEHAYSTGLLLLHWLTGDARPRQAVLKMAGRVIAMDDGGQHWLAPLCRSRTGESSSTSQSTYHGLGRGVGNSINTLTDAWLLDPQQVYVDKAEELIRRCVSPGDDIDDLELANIELRWSYTVGLQALVRFYLNVPTAHADLRAYIQASLLHYGRWMLANEDLALNRPDELEFPTETWAAQDLRKANCLLMIACFARGQEADSLRRRGEELFRAAWEQLMEFPSRLCTRPAAIVLQQLPIHDYFREHSANWGLEPEELARYSWPARPAFVPQKELFKQQLKSPAGWLSVVGAMLHLPAWRYLLAETPAGGWVRGMRRRLS